MSSKFPSCSQFGNIEQYIPADNLFQEDQDKLFSTQFAIHPNIASVIAKLESSQSLHVARSLGLRAACNSVTELPADIAEFVSSHLLRKGRNTSQEDKQSRGASYSFSNPSNLSIVAHKPIGMSDATDSGAKDVCKEGAWISMDQVWSKYKL